jgi:hypothetical protein
MQFMIFLQSKGRRLTPAQNNLQNYNDPKVLKRRYLYIYGSTALVGLGRFFSLLILYTVSRTPWTGDQPVAKPLPTHRTHTNTE